MSVGSKISELRKINNFSQEQLAEKIGVSRQTISNWELDESSPDLKQSKLLANIFNVSLNILAELEEQPKKTNTGSLTIVSAIENVVVTCSKVQSSMKFKGGKDAPKYALFATTENMRSGATFLGWYASREDISKEIKEISEAFKFGNLTYELKYNVMTKKKFGIIKMVDEKDQD